MNTFDTKTLSHYFLFASDCIRHPNTVIKLRKTTKMVDYIHPFPMIDTSQGAAKLFSLAADCSHDEAKKTPAYSVALRSIDDHIQPCNGI